MKGPSEEVLEGNEPESRIWRRYSNLNVSDRGYNTALLSELYSRTEIPLKDRVIFRKSVFRGEEFSPTVLQGRPAAPWVHPGSSPTPDDYDWFKETAESQWAVWEPP